MATDDGAQIEAVRRFNRFYTQRIGVLEESLLASSFTLAQARVLFELGTGQCATAGELGSKLGLDPGYLSRILQGFVKTRLLVREHSSEDARRLKLSLTPRGRSAFAALDDKSRETIAALIASLSRLQRERLVSAMRAVEAMLSSGEQARAARVTIRPYAIGDVGWAIEQHGRLYAQEFGWNDEFEALVASLFARFVSSRQAASEQFWVAEIGDERVGCVFVVRNDEDPKAAQLRCLLIDPSARGLGLGRRLVEECIRFAKSAGYERILLWTNDVLTAARRVYEKAGFSLVREYPHHSFGHDLVGQIWMRTL